MKSKQCDRRIPGHIQQLLVVQLIMTLLITLACVLIASKKSAISAFLGGMIAITPSLLFAKHLFRYQGARAARQIVSRFYFGEVLKIILTGVLFALILKHLDSEPKVLFTTYAVILIAHFFTPLFFTNKRHIITAKKLSPENKCP